MAYKVKEIFATLQGEGFHTGRAAVFCRFSGCNLWTGLEKDRSTAVCQFCDTDFRGTNGAGGGTFNSPEELADSILECWHKNTVTNDQPPFMVCTGGEPLLQLDDDLVHTLHDRGIIIAIETNGTIEASAEIDWICVSPKAGANWIQKSGNELKLVFPQTGLLPTEIQTDSFDHLFLQPMDGPDRDENTARAVRFCRSNPPWKLSLQTHKYLNIP
jgi:7-carboxy-7-deazaguanine synthase